MIRQTKLVHAAVALSLLHLVIVIAQPFLGGVMLGGGDFDALPLHSWNGRLAFVVCGLAVAAMAAAWRERSFPAALPAFALTLLAVEGWQIHLGFVDDLMWHIPVGTLSVAGAAVLAYATARAAANPTTERA